MSPAWRVYYADGSTWSDLDGPVGSAPRFGVVSISFADETGLCLAERGDYYVLHSNGKWTAHDRAGLDHLLARDLDGVAAIAFGEQVSDLVWQEVHSRAATDPAFCDTSGGKLAVCSDGTKMLLRRQPDGSWRGFVQ